MNGIDAWVADQLARSQADENVENLLSDYPNLRRSPLEIWNALSDNGRVGWEHIHAQLVRARYSSNQLFEMMTHLWMDHFNISFGGNDQALTFAYQENVIRPNSMGRFVDLLVATAESGSMMIYLDNARSDARQGINENYGRELLELHTLGIDRQGAQIYTEEDVAGVAHVMSGWAAERSRNQPNWGQFVYRPEFHSTDSVSILGGQWSNAGLAGKAAGDNLLQFLARHPQTANYVAWKICRRFVSDEPSEALIASAAQVYLANDTDIVAVLRHVFASAEFVNSGGQKARRPFEILVAAMRSLGSSLPVDPLGDAAGDLNFALNRMGHEPWSWETPDGFPDDARSWVNSNSLLISWELTSRMARDRLTRPDDASPLITPLNVLRGGSTNAGELFERLTFRCNLGDLPDGLRDQLLGLVNATADTPIDDVSDDALAELVSFLLAHPLFQLR